MSPNDGKHIEGDPPRSEAVRRQIRGSTLLLVGRFVGAGLGLVVQVLIVRTLTQADYGAFAFALAIAGVGEVVALFGTRKSVSRYMPIYLEDDDKARALGTLFFTAATIITVGLAFVLVVTVFRGLIAGELAADPLALRVLVILAVLAPIMAAETALDATFAVFTRPLAIFLRQYVLVPALRLLAVFIMIGAGAGIEVLAIGFVIGGLLGLAIAGLGLVRILRDHDLLTRIRDLEITVPARMILLFSIPMFSDDLTAILIEAADAIMLGHLGTAEQVATLRAVLPVARVNMYVTLAFGLLFMPLAARLLKRRELTGLRNLYWQTALWSATLAFPALAIMVVLADPLAVFLFGERYADAGPVLAVLAIGYYFTAMVGPNGPLLAVHGRMGIIVGTNAIAVAANVTANLLLIPRYGALGAAYGTLITIAIHDILKQIAIHRTTSVPGLERQMVPAYSVVLGGAVAIGLLYWWSPSIGVGIAATVAISLLVLIVGRRYLDIAETFPELTRIPVVRWLAGPDTGGKRG